MPTNTYEVRLKCEDEHEEMTLILRAASFEEAYEKVKAKMTIIAKHLGTYFKIEHFNKR